MKLGSHWITRLAVAGSILLFSPLAVIHAASNPYAKFAGVYASDTPPPDEAGRPSKPMPTMSLSLGADGSATLTEDPGTGSRTLFGHWRDSGGQVTVDFNPVDGKPAEPSMAFESGHDGLRAVTWNHAIWGKATPPLMKKDNGNWHGGHHRVF